MVGESFPLLTCLLTAPAGVIFYLTQFYKRNEIAFRLSIFYGMVTIAGEYPFSDT